MKEVVYNSWESLKFDVISRKFTNFANFNDVKFLENSWIIIFEKLHV